MTELSDKKSAPAVTESLGGAAALGAEVNPRSSPITIWAAIGGALLLLQLYVWIRWITGPVLRAGAWRPDRSADVHEGLPDVQRHPHVRRPADRHLVVHHQALASGAANHARRHAAGVDGPDVLPGPVAELLQHLVHLQHLAVEPRLLVVGHPGVGVTRGTGSTGR